MKIYGLIIIKPELRWRLVSNPNRIKSTIFLIRLDKITFTVTVKMKTSTLIKFFPIVLAIALIFANLQLVRAQVVQIERDFQPDPLTLSGKSG